MDERWKRLVAVVGIEQTTNLYEQLERAHKEAGDLLVANAVGIQAHMSVDKLSGLSARNSFIEALEAAISHFEQSWEYSAANRPATRRNERPTALATELPKTAVSSVTEPQWQRLNDLLTEGAVVELAWLRSAAGLRRDSAVQVMDVLAQSGCCTATTLVFHDCAERPVATGPVEWPWECPDCESVLDSDDADQVRLERQLRLTKTVRFV